MTAAVADYSGCGVANAAVAKLHTRGVFQRFYPYGPNDLYEIADAQTWDEAASFCNMSAMYELRTS